MSAPRPSRRPAAARRSCDLPLEHGGRRGAVPAPQAAHAGAPAPARPRRAGRARAAGLAVGLLAVVARPGPRYAKVMASDRLRVGRLEVRGSHFLSEGEVRELLGPAVGENILGLDIDALEGAAARLALGGRRHRARAPCPTPCGSRSASACPWPSPRSTAST